jgi:serine/threonine-protein kinase HipA
MANIYVNRQAVGTLSREEPLNRFAYDNDAGEAQAVSLLMPVNIDPYFAERPGALPPIFDMSLPEGVLKDAIANLFAKALPIFDDLALFRIVGRSLIGRIRSGEAPAELDQVPAQNLSDLLKSRGTNELFSDLLRRYAEYSGIAGVQPKVLVRDDGGLQTEALSPIPTDQRVTARGATHIVKSFDPVGFPGLAANELFCLRAARAAGAETPQVNISADGRVLVIARFDLKTDGSFRAFEDGCALDGRLAREKYMGSYEQLAGTFGNVLSRTNGGVEELTKLFRSLVLSVAVRNGDAHRKNFGVVYDDPAGEVLLAPTFDVITTAPYVPNDSLALTIDGTKRWPDARRLERFGVRRCQLSPTVAKAIIAEVREAVAGVAHDFDSFRDLDPNAGETPQRMRTAWAEGVASLSERIGA